MIDAIKIICLIIVGYFMGNLSISRLLTSRNNDITKQGSGNPGTMNMLRNHGVKKAFITLIGDALKAAIPALIGRYVLFPGDDSWGLIALFIGGLSAVVGHMYPIFYNFKGGKGIACTVGICFVANPILALCLVVPAFLFLWFVKIGSLTSMVYIIPFALMNSCISDIKYNIVALILMWFTVILDVFAHRTNFIRLFANEERLTSFKEGVKKDIARVRDKKIEKIDDLTDKEQEVKEHYDAKLEKKKLKYKKKRAKSIHRLAKKKEKLQMIYNRQIEEIKEESAEIIMYMQERIDKKNQRKQDKEESIEGSNSEVRINNEEDTN